MSAFAVKPSVSLMCSAFECYTKTKPQWVGSFSADGSKTVVSALSIHLLNIVMSSICMWTCLFFSTWWLKQCWICVTVSGLSLRVGDFPQLLLSENYRRKIEPFTRQLENFYLSDNPEYVLKNHILYETLTNNQKKNTLIGKSRGPHDR